MKNKTLPLFNGFIFGFRWSLDKFALFFSILLIYALVVLVGFLAWLVLLSLPLLRTSDYFTIFQLILGLFVLSVIFTIDLGFIKICLDIHDTGKAQLKTLFSYVHRAVQGVSLMFLYILGTLLGLLFFIVPGVIFAIRSMFALYFFVDKDMSVIDAFQKSFHITKGYTISLLPFVIFSLLFPADISSSVSFLSKGMALVNMPFLSGFLSSILLAGILFYPVFYLAGAYVYRFLSVRTDNEYSKITFKQEISIE